MTEVEERNYPEIDRLFQEILNDPEVQKEDEVFVRKVCIICLAIVFVVSAIVIVLELTGTVQ